MQYRNGNATVSIDLKTGTRIIDIPDNEVINLEYPLNIDITFFEGCSLNNYCTFCHVHTNTSEAEGNYELVKRQLSSLPAGVELTIACNKFTDNLQEFLKWSKNQGFICNLNVNQLHYPVYFNEIKQAMEEGLVYGVGISLRDADRIKDDLCSEEWQYAMFNPSIVIHVIVGIDHYKDIQWALETFSKIVILGYKSVGKGGGINQHRQVSLNNTTRILTQQMPRILKAYQNLKGSVISFDNPAIEQLKMSRFFTKDQWDRFYNDEYSLYVDGFNETINASSYSRTYYLPLEEYSIKDAFAMFKKNIAPEVEFHEKKKRLLPSKSLMEQVVFVP